MGRLFSNRSRLAGLFAGLALAAYLPALGSGFIWNDSDYVTKPALRSLGGLWRIWFEVGATQQYYPLLHSAFWLEHRLWGDAAFGYHLVNVLLHATSAFLLVLCLRLSTVERDLRARCLDYEPGPLVRGTAPASGPGTRLRLPIWKTSPWQAAHSTFDVPLLAGLLFLLHPVCVESVAWISEQKNTLSTVFYLLSALTYLRWEAGRGVGGSIPEGWRSHSVRTGPSPTSGRASSLQWIALLLFVCACLTKTVAATLPGALLVVIWWQRGSLSWRRDFVPLIPWFAVGAASGLFTAWVEKTYVGAQGSEFGLDALQRALLAGHAVWFYLGKLAWPANLIFIYPRWTVSASDPLQWVYPIGVVALVAALWLWRGRSRAPLAALLFFLGSLFPVCGFFNLYAFIYSYVADHWQYLPAVGVVSLAAGAWGTAVRGGPLARPAVRNGVPILVLAILGLLTFRQSGMYRDMETFYRRTIASNPACWMAENNLGDLYEHEGRLGDAIAHYDRALGIKPSAKTHYNKGTVLRREGKLDEAVLEFETAIAMAPDFADARNNLGGTLGEMGRIAEAVGQLEEALRIDPNSAAIRSNLGICLAREGRTAEASVQLREAIRLDPGSAEAMSNLGTILRREGRYPEAVELLERALRIRPSMPVIHVNMGIALAMEDRLDEAVDQFREAIRLDPNSADAHNDLGNALAHLGRNAEARSEFVEALRLNPGLTDARLNLDQLPPP